MAAEDVPTLEVGFAINPESSYAELARLQEFMNSTEAKIIADAAKIEQATGGMMSLTGPTARITSFGNATSREMLGMVRETNKAEKAAETMVRQIERQIETFGKSSAEIRQMRSELRAAEAESRGLTELAARLRATSAELDRLEGANDNFARSGHRSRGVVAQLIPQFNDLGVQFAMAAQSSNPLQMAMMALIQQGAQIQQIGMQAGLGIGGMAKQVASATGTFLLANPAILAVGAGIGVAAFAFKGFSDTLEKRAPVDDYIKKLGLTSEEAKKLTDRHVTLGDAAGAAWDVISKGLQLESVFKTLDGWVSQSAIWLYDQFKDATASIYGFFKATYDNVGLLWKNLPALLGDAVTATVNEVLNAVQSLINDTISKLNWVAQKSNEIFGTAFGQIGKVDFSSYKGQYSAAGKDFAAAFGASFKSAYGEAIAGYESIEDGSIKKMQDRLKKQGDKLIDDRKKASTKAADDAAKEAAKQEKWLADQRMTAQGNVWKLAQEMEARNRALKLDGLTVGEKMLEQEQSRAKLREAELQGQREILDMYLRQLDTVSRIGGAAGGLAGIVAGILDGGNFLGVGGGVGRLLNASSSVIGKDGWQKVTGKLDDIFGGGGKFASTMSSILPPLAIASSANQIIGDIFGFKGGPLGLLTNPISNLLNPSRSAGAVITGANSVRIGGKDAGQYGVAGDLSGAVVGGLQQIANQLGGTLGNFRTTIGIRDGDYRVNASGDSLKTKNGAVDFGKDSQAAVMFAIADAVKDGAIMGLRAGSQALIRQGKDVEVQITKAVQFESVFTELRSLTDPLGYATEQLDKWRETMRATFAEAGASAEEYAQLQQLYDLKRNDALKQANEEAASLTRDRRTLEARIMELQGKTIDSVTAMRQIELEQMEASLRPLQEQVWALEDAKDAADAAKQLADTWGSIGDSIMDEVRRIRGLTDTSGGGSFASLFGQFNAATSAARGGDQDAANRLVGLSQSVLDAAALSATSRQELDRIRAQIAASLEQTAGLVGSVKGSVLAAATPLTPGLVSGGSAASTLRAAAQVAPMPSSNDNAAAELRSLRAEVAQLRDDNNKGHAATAGNTGKMARVLDQVTADSGGDAISVSGAAA